MKSLDECATMEAGLSLAGRDSLAEGFLPLRAVASEGRLVNNFEELEC